MKKIIKTKTTGGRLRLPIILGFFILGLGSSGQADPARHISPSAVEILVSMAENSATLKQAFREFSSGTATTMIDPGLALADLLNGDFRVKLEPKVDTLPRKVKITLYPLTSGEGQPLMAAKPGGLTTPFFDFVPLAKQVAAITYPASTDNMTVDQWRTTLGLPDLRNKIDDRSGTAGNLMSLCATKVQSRARDYWFSVVPVNMECNSVLPLNVHSAIDLLWMPMYDSDPTAFAQKPIPDVVKNAKRNLGTELLVAAIIQHAQIVIGTEDGASAATRIWARNKARCFPAKGYAVRTTLAAQVVPFAEKTPGSNSFEYGNVLSMMHPEGLYAIAQHVQYYGSTVMGTLGDIAKGNRYVMFNNRVDGTGVTEMPSLLLKAEPLATASGSLPLKFNPTGTMHFMFNIRDLMSSPTCTGTSPLGPIQAVPFCQMPKAESKMRHDS